MAKVKVLYEEIDGVKYKVKDPTRKKTVLAYQEMIMREHADYISQEMNEAQKRYAEKLFNNIASAPFVFLWLHKPEPKKEKKTPVKKKTKKKGNTSKKK